MITRRGLAPDCVRETLALGRRFAIVWAVLLALLPASAHGQNGEKFFRLPAGQAIVTLKAFAVQANAKLLYSVEAVAQARTNAVKGAYLPHEALIRMLAGTGLIVSQSQRDGAFAVTRPVPAPTDIPPKKNDMKILPPRRALVGFLMAAFSVSSGVGSASGQSDQASPGNESGQNQKPIVLSPFDVNAETDVGYGAGATASTSRIIQNYVDVPQSVNVVTSEFLTDFNLEDVRSALEYVSNVQFGLTDNPYSTRVRGAVVSATYIDGVSMPNSYSALPMDFFDRIEVVKGPSSAAFGLGQPGGLINYVSKTAGGTDATSLSFSLGGYNSYIARIDTQGIDAKNSKLSYRLVGFWEDGGYPTRDTYHSGTGAQLSLRYDLNSTTRFDLIVAYSQTSYPADGNTNNIWLNKTIYQTWQGTNLGASTYQYLPGTVFPNGSIFGVKGTLPPPGTEIGILGTGDLVGSNSNAAPQGWDADNENTFRDTLVFTKDFADGHVHLRNAATLAFNLSTIYDTGPNGVIAIPGSANTLPAAAAGNPGYGEPGGVNPLVGTPYSNTPGAPYFGISYSHDYGQTNSSQRNDEFDLLINYHFLGGDWQTLVGGDFYDDESSSFGYSEPSINADGTPAYPTLYSNSNPAAYLSPNHQVTGWSNGHEWGDGFYAQEDLNLFNDRLDLLAGWRIDYFDNETIDYATNQRSFPGWVNTKGAPRFAVTVKPLKWLSLYELYTKHADPTQSTNKYFLNHGTEWAGTPLATEFPEGELEFFQPGGYTVESGVKASLFDGKVYASVAVFHELLTGQINPIVPPGGNVTNPDGTVSEIGENEIQGLNAHGIEVEIFGQATRRLNFTANYGIVRGYFPAFSNGLPDFEDPSATASLHGKFDFGDLRGNGFYLTFGGEWLGPYYIYQQSNFYEYYSSSQYLADGGIGYRWRNGKYRQSLYFNMDNIMNEVVSIGTVTPWTIEPLRSFYLTYKISY